MPDFEVSTVDGASVGRADLDGRVAVLHFWAAYYHGSHDNLGVLQRLSERHPSAVFLGIAFDSGGRGEVAELARAAGAEFPQALGTAELLRAFDIGMLATTVVVGADGGMRVRAYGRVELASYDELLRELESR